MSEARDQISILRWPQECDRLGQESLKTKDLQEKVLALQVGNVDLGWVLSQQQNLTDLLVNHWDTYEPSSCWGARCPGLAFETVFFEKVWNYFG